MTSHDPCAGHSCDYCWICTDLGVCCGAVPPIKSLADRVPRIPSRDRTQELKAAIEAESSHLSMVDLVKIDVEMRLLFGSETHTCNHDAQQQITTLNVSVSLPALPPGEDGGLFEKLQADITTQTVQVESN